MDTKESIEHFFVPFNLVDFWPRIAAKYDYFKFTDHISDAERYGEFVWINEQFRKFIGTKKAPVMKHIYNLEKMREYVESLIVDSAEKADTDCIRAWLVYTALRNEWLQSLLYTITMLMEDQDGSYGIE